MSPKNSCSCFLLGVMILLNINLVIGQVCPLNYVVYGSSCYRFVWNNPKNWWDAKTWCKVQGGNLLKIETTAEWTWASKYLNYLHTHQHAPNTWWTGLNDNNAQSSFQWGDNSPVNERVIVWQRGAPNNAGNGEHCVRVENQKLNDRPCSEKIAYVCERARGIPLTCDRDHGWQSYPPYCYKVHNDHQNFNRARTNCLHDGGDLVTIATSNDETIMQGLARTSNKPFWIGLHSSLSNNKVVWTWTNGTVLDPSVTYWTHRRTPYLPANRKNNSCAYVINTATNLYAWQAMPCTSSRNYVCRKPEGVCQAGWVAHQRHCYQFNIRFKYTWAQSKSFCDRQGTRLVEIYGSTDQNFMEGYLTELREAGIDSFWIGATDFNKTTYTWSHNGPIRYTSSWIRRPTAPNTANKQDCVFIATGDRLGRWRNTANCIARKAFVCMSNMNQSIKVVPTPRPQYICDPHWILHGSYCYQFNDARKAWMDAAAVCSHYTKGQLAKITKSDVQAFINSHTHNQEYWIGLNDQKQERHFVWADNSQMTYHHWNPHEPNNQNGENCVETLHSGWNDKDCSTHLKFICQKPASNSQLPIGPTKTTNLPYNLKCGELWNDDHNTEFCYQFHDQQLDWEDARTTCQQQGGDLLSIGSREEQFYVAGKISTMSSIGVWMGANDRAHEGQWKWSDGTPFAYFNWGAGEPNDYRHNEDCVMMFTQKATWNDATCTTRNGFICKKLGFITTRLQTITTPHVPAGMTLGCARNWKKHGTACYLFIKQTVNWNQGRSLCRTHGGYMASIGNQNEQNYIMSQLPRSGYGYWLGLNDLDTEMKFQWTDGSRITYTHWGPGEPNNYRGHEEDCVQIYLRVGTWNDNQCNSRSQGVVCKRPLQVVSATQSQSSVGCPASATGYQSSCYYFEKRQNKRWQDANNDCAHRFHGRLATVNNRFTQAFISSNLLYQSDYFWIGMSDKMTPGTYKWSSGTAVAFTFWDSSHTADYDMQKYKLYKEDPSIPVPRSTFHRHKKLQDSPSHDTKGSEVNTNSTQYTAVSGSTYNSGDNSFHYNVQGYDSKSDQYSDLPRPGKSTSLDQCSEELHKDKCTFNQRNCFGHTVASNKPVDTHTVPDAVYEEDSFNTEDNSVIDLESDIYISSSSDSEEERSDIGTESISDLSSTSEDDGSVFEDEQATSNIDTFSKSEEKSMTLLAYVMKHHLGGQASKDLLSLAKQLDPELEIKDVNQLKQVVRLCDPGTVHFCEKCFTIFPKDENVVHCTQNGCSGLRYKGSVHQQHLKRKKSFFTTLPICHQVQDILQRDGIWSSLCKYRELCSASPNITDLINAEIYTDLFQPGNLMGSEHNTCISLLFNTDGVPLYKSSGVSLWPVYLVINELPPALRFARKNIILWGIWQSHGKPVFHTFLQPFVQHMRELKDIGIQLNINKQEIVVKAILVGGTMDLQAKAYLASMTQHNGHFGCITCEDPGEVVKQGRGHARVYPYRQQTDIYKERTSSGNEHGTCVAMTTTTPIGLWKNRQCTESHHYICEFQRAGYTTPPHPTPLTVPCPHGWVQSTPQSAYCYKVFYNDTVASKQTWMQAKDYCRSLGGDLPSIHNNVTEAFFKNRLLSNFTGSFWIGLNDRATEAGYVWSDGSGTDYTDWNHGEPNDFHKNEDCVQFVTYTHSWNDNNCYMSTNFVCQIRRGVVPLSTAALPTAAQNPACGSDASWNYYNGSCYLLSPPSGTNFLISWHDANTYCVGIHASLASIHSLQETDFLISLTSKRSMSSFWIGFNMLTGHGYSWVDQSAVDYDFWFPGQPDNFFKSEMCVDFHSKAGGWNDENCNNHHGFVCKKRLGQPPATPAPTALITGGCKPGFIADPHSNKCYMVAGTASNAQLNWSQARSACQQNGVGYDLASVNSAYDQAFVNTLLRGVKTSVWFGLNNLFHQKHFAWADNSYFHYTNWAPGEPNGHSKFTNLHALHNVEKCGMLYPTPFKLGQWNDFNCNNQNAYLCQGTKAANLPPRSLQGTCGTGYTSYGSSCYKKVTSPAKTWQDANSACTQEGGTLVNINDVYENYYLTTMYGKENIWIGMTFSQQLNRFLWAQNWPVTFTNWGDGEPTQGTSDTCVYSQAGSWNDTDCRQTFAYVCEISSVAAPPATTPYPGHCADSSHVLYRDNCYFFDPFHLRSWPEAGYMCSKMGMTLVSIHSIDELLFVRNTASNAKFPTNDSTAHQFNSGKPDSVWIGLSRGTSVGFTWSDSTPVNFLKWNTGEPSDTTGVHNEECVQMYLSKQTGNWNDINCFNNYGYVCKVKAVGPTTPVPMLTATPAQVTQRPVTAGPTQRPVTAGPTQRPVTAGPTQRPVTAGPTQRPVTAGPISHPHQLTFTPRPLHSAAQRGTSKKSSSGLSGGAVAGIIIAVIVILGGISLALLFMKKKGLAFQKSSTNGFDNALYLNTEQSVHIDPMKHQSPGGTNGYMSGIPGEDDA